MENLEEQIETLTKLMASLDIPSEVEEENNNVVYDYNSDENPYENPYVDYNFAQKRKQSYMEEDFQKQFEYKLPTEAETYLYRQGMVKNKMNKWEAIPPQYIPKLSIMRMDSDILNIDCETNTDEKIQEWSNRMSAQMQLTEELRNLKPRDFLNYIIHKTSGNVYKYLESLSLEEKTQMITLDTMTTFNNIIAKIIQEFTGRILESTTSIEAFRDHAFWHLVNLKICNMCYLENYICEFSEYYYKLGLDKQKITLEMFFNKLPESVAKKVNTGFSEAIKTKDKINDTLGARISFLRLWMQAECLQKTAEKESMVKLCCERQANRIGNYGCDEPQKKRKKIWKKQSYNPKYKNYYKKNNRQNYFRNRKQHRSKFKQENREEYCPSKKMDCKCWLCQEEGHYANQCPKRSKKKETEILKVAYDLGYEPLEDSEVDSDIEIYAYTTESSDHE